MNELERLLLLVSLLNKAASLSVELMRLSERVIAGEKITDEELDAANAKMHAAVEGWKAAAKPAPAEPFQPADG